MKLTIEITMNNAAFGDDALSRAVETEMILAHVAIERVISEGSLPLHDTNGNTVGIARIEN